MLAKIVAFPRYFGEKNIATFYEGSSLINAGTVNLPICWFIKLHRYSIPGEFVSCTIALFISFHSQIPLKFEREIETVFSHKLFEKNNRRNLLLVFFARIYFPRSYLFASEEQKHTLHNDFIWDVKTPYWQIFTPTRNFDRLAKQ